MSSFAGMWKLAAEGEGAESKRSGYRGQGALSGYGLERVKCVCVCVGVCLCVCVCACVYACACE